MAGAVLGLALAVLLELKNDLVRTEDDSKD